MDEKKQELNNLLQSNKIIIPSYLHYGGISGFHDYGIIGHKIKTKLLEHWRNTFLFKDEIDEIETPAIMPYEILKISGHVDKFTDYVVYDKSGKCFRADHLVEDYFVKNRMDDKAKQVDSYKAEQLEKFINDYEMIEMPVKEINKVSEGDEFLELVKI